MNKTANDISNRQLDILNAIIVEFLKSSELEMIPSSLIVEQYNVDACPATVRSEMVRLEKQGFLTKPHVSAGRVPSDIGIKYYISNLMEEEELPISSKERIKNALLSHTDNINQLIYRIAELLSSIAEEPVVVSFDNVTVQRGLYRLHKYRELYYASNIFESLAYIENPTHIIDKVRNSNNQVFVLVGDDFEQKELSMYAIVGMLVKGYQDKEGLIGVYSSKRMHYPSLIPIVRFIGSLFSSTLKKWSW